MRSRDADFLLGNFNSDAAVRGEGYDLVTADDWQDTNLLAQTRDEGYKDGILSISPYRKDLGVPC